VSTGYGRGHEAGSHRAHEWESGPFRVLDRGLSRADIGVSVSHHRARNPGSLGCGDHGGGERIGHEAGHEGFRCIHRFLNMLSAFEA
jgi:hypothetical protein